MYIDRFNLELVRTGNTIAAGIYINLAVGDFDEDLGPAIDGSASLTIGSQTVSDSDDFEGFIDIGFAAALVPGQLYDGSATLRDVFARINESGTFKIVLFDTATTYAGTGSVDYIFGSALADTLGGAAGNDAIEAGDGNDLVDGGAGNDLLYGGAGNDTLDGGLGNDVLSGGPGSDVLKGGAGNDTYLIDRKGATLVDASGIDTVKATISWTLANAIENLVLDGAKAINGTGNAKGNVITGNHKANVLSGLGGNDRLNGGAGNDKLLGSAGNDDLDGHDGKDLLLGGDGNDKLFGSSGSDTLIGGNGRDVLSGDTEKDILTGGAGSDVFNFGTYNAPIATGRFPASRDVITDFRHGTDKIDLKLVDANGGAAGNGTFKFLAAEGAHFSGARGELRWYHIDAAGTAKDKTIIEGDFNGDKHAEFQIELTGLKTLTKGDFIL